MPKDTTEGLGAVAQLVLRQFHLPEPDEAYLSDMGLPWETVNENGILWLFINGWTVPHGYNHPDVSVALIIPPNYPDTQIDMVYFRPALVRTDGKSIGALADQQICGQVWQRWSRQPRGNYPGPVPWRDPPRSRDRTP